eukprot:2733860-Pyramimonas_sp.AAC.1
MPSLQPPCVSRASYYCTRYNSDVLCYVLDRPGGAAAAGAASQSGGSDSYAAIHLAQSGGAKRVPQREPANHQEAEES